MVLRNRPCHVLYGYQFHPQMGWMHQRLQTWFPFNVQIAINGREWLARQMDRAGVRYRQQGNCFVWVEDYKKAQALLDEQLQTCWPEVLGKLEKQLNPNRERIFEHYPCDYYWSVFQSEWATDMVFRNGEELKRLMPLLTRHGMLSMHSPDVMRYFGKKVNQSGEIPANFRGKVETDWKRRQEGERVKYRLNGNSVKFYDKAYAPEGSVLRAAETTINQPQDFRVYRPKEGGPQEDLQWRSMRKGVADLNRRAEVSQSTNHRLIHALASVDDSRRIEELIQPLQKHTTYNGRRVRAMIPCGEDQQLLAAINHGEFLINGFRNRDLQKLLYSTENPTAEQKRKRSAAISRKIRLLRAHHIIQKVPRTNRYHVTEKARPILMAVLTALRTSLNQLNQLPCAA